MYKEYRHQDVYSHIEQCAKGHGDKVAVYVGEESVSYDVLLERAERLAGCMGEVLSGWPKGERPVRVGVFLRRNAHVEAMILALMRLGCTYVPIDVETPRERVSFMAADASLAFVVTERAVGGLLPGEVRCLLVEEMLEHERMAAEADFSTSEHEAYVIYTSGTTGRPKGVLIDYTNLYYYLLTAGREDHFHIHSESVVLHYTTVNFDVSVIEIFTALFYGATLVVAEEEDRRDVKRVYGLINRRGVTYMSLPPTMFNLFPDYNFTAMETACAGGEVMPRSLVGRIGTGRPYRFLNAYGPAECTPVSCVREMTDEGLWRNIGWASHYAVFHVVDEEMRQVGPGEEGELLIGGPQVFHGYLNRPELTKEKLTENPFEESRERAPRLYHTGDLVRLMPDGSCEFLGRMDSQVKIYGRRIELDEILAQLEKCGDVHRAFLTVESHGMNRSIVAFVRPRDLGICRSNEETRRAIARIKGQLSEMLPNYMIPVMWNFVEDFPLTLNGKIDKKKLVNRPFYYIKKENPQELTSDERILKQEVAKVIGFDDISIDADLYDVYGLTSIQTMQISMELNPMGMQISALEMYKHRTIREIARNRDTRLCYWYNDDDNTTKPVIVVVCGYTSFGFMYTQWADRLTGQYSLFVIEYYHAIIGNRRIGDIEELMSSYRAMAQPVIDKHDVCCITGMCMGGEHALLLAHQLYLNRAEKPHVIVIDGEIDRDVRSETNAHLRFPFLTDEENDIRVGNDFTLMRTYPDFCYEGKLTVFQSGKFIDYYSYLDPDWNETKARGMRMAFDTCVSRWEKHYPDCLIGILPSDHNNFWCSEPSLTIVTDYFKQMVQNNEQ